MSAGSERRSDLLALSPLTMVDRIIELEDGNELAHKLAEESAKSLLECSLLSWKDAQGGGSWLDLRSGYRNEDYQFFIDRAVRYLESEGILKRFSTDPEMIGWDEMDEDEVDA
jgi:hypothetical protein